MFPGCVQMATLIVTGPISTGGLIVLFMDALGVRIDAFGAIPMLGESDDLV